MVVAPVIFFIKKYPSALFSCPMYRNHQTLDHVQPPEPLQSHFFVNKFIKKKKKKRSKVKTTLLMRAGTEVQTQYQLTIYLSM